MRQEDNALRLEGIPLAPLSTGITDVKRRPLINEYTPCHVNLKFATTRLRTRSWQNENGASNNEGAVLTS